MKTFLRASVGLIFGGLLFWFAVSHVNLTDLASTLKGARLDLMLVAVVVYWAGIAVRVIRWRILLSASCAIGFPQVAESLIVGYAVNNVLPARLGELFRADYIRRRFGVARSAALGSIIVERLLDAIAVLAMLAFGLLTAKLKPHQMALTAAAWLASAGIAAGVLFVVGTVSWHDRLPLDRWPWLRNRVTILAQAMSIVHRPAAFLAVAASAVVWALEAAALELVLLGFGTPVDISGLSLIMGAAALSTLLPSAPGYVGSLQVAYYLAFSALAITPVLAVVVSTATQILLLGSVTVVGLVLYLRHQLYRTAISLKLGAR